MNGILTQRAAIDAVTGVGGNTTDHIAWIDIFQVYLHAALIKMMPQSWFSENVRYP